MNTSGRYKIQKFGMRWFILDRTLGRAYCAASFFHAARCVSTGCPPYDYIPSHILREVYA